MLAFLLAFAGDWLGSLGLLRLTHRWWLLLPGALLIGIVSGFSATLVLSLVMDVRPGPALLAAMGAASLHAMLSAPLIFWLRWRHDRNSRTVGRSPPDTAA